MENNFRVEVKNFGAVKDGVFDIKPLTIFIGDNDSGKSYISKFIYIVVKYLSQHSNNFLNTLDKKPYENTKIISELNKISSITNSESQITFTLDEDFINLYMIDIQKNFTQIIQKSLEIYFSNNLGDLININSKTASIFIYLEFIDIEIIITNDGKIDLILKNNKIIKFELNIYTRVNDTNESLSMNYGTENNKISMNISFNGKLITDIDYLFSKTIEMIFYSKSIFLSFPHSVDYFPANKSGILSNYNTKFQNSSMSLATDYIFNNKNMNQDNYIVNDFIQIIQDYSIKKIKENENLTQSYKYILNSIDGKVHFNENNKLQYKIGNKYNSLDIPIENISTKITELTSIILYLKELDKNYLKNFLIIEEPESHLNPKMQRIMARLIVMMMNEGIQILITTHSDYILNEMDILLKLNHIKEKDEKVFDKFIDEDKDYESLMALDRDDLSVYRFKKEGLDTEIENIKITKNKVIEKEFEETSENLYLENSKVIEILKSI